MKNSFTLHDFFLLCHNETDGWKDQELTTDGFSEEGWRNEYPDYYPHSGKSLDTLVAPDKKIIDNIMGYARALYQVKTKTSGYFSILLN
jgi:hypothetical protein